MPHKFPDLTDQCKPPTREQIAHALSVLAAAILAPAAAANDTDLLTLAEAAALAKCAKAGIRAAIHAGDLTPYGKTRDRSVKRGDVLRWIETRRAGPVEAPADDLIERRMARLAASGSR